MKQLRTLVDHVADTAKRATDVVSEAAGATVRAIPTVDEAKKGLWTALVFGGKALIDPQKVVGQLAIQMGESLGGGSAKAWVALAASEGGFEVVGHGEEGAVRSQFEAAVSSGRTTLLCKVVQASEAKGGE